MSEQLNNREQKIDEKWYQKLEQFPSTELFAWFGLNKNDSENSKQRKELKENFLKAIESQNESFFESDKFKITYPFIESKDKSFFTDNIKLLEELKKEINLNETNDSIKKLYIFKIDQKINEFNALLAIKNHDQKKFSEYSEKIYGSPNKSFFDQARNELLKNIAPYLGSSNNQIKTIAQQLTENLEKNLNKEDVFQIPDFVFEVKDLANISKKTAEYVSFSSANLGFLNAKEIFKAGAAKSIFNQELKKLGAINDTPNSWQVEINEGVQSFSVNQKDRVVTLPASIFMNYKEITSLAEHEINTHVKRGFQGENSILKLLRLGLSSRGGRDAYERSEEGIAVYNEQKVTGSKTIRGLNYIAVSFAKGLDGEPKNFKQVFEILKNAYFFDSIKNINIESKDSQEQKEIINSNLKKAENSAYEFAYRTFRGTDFNNKQGYCFTKDIVYREGSIGIWQLIERQKNIKSPNQLKEFIRTFTLGKWDPTNSDQYYLLSELNVIK